MFSNDFACKEIIEFLKDYLERDPIEYEAHIVLWIEILSSLLVSCNDMNNILILVYAPQFYDVFVSLRDKMNRTYENDFKDPTLHDFNSKIDSFISFLYPTKLLTQSKEVVPLMKYLNDLCFSNVQKYNLNEKPVNEDNNNNNKDQIKEYIKGMKLNILNFFNKDPNFFETIHTKYSLINGIFLALTSLNISVTFFNKFRFILIPF